MKDRQIAVSDKTIRVEAGDSVELRIASDETGEPHLHGYDVAINLQAGKTTVTIILAEVAGRYPITSHGFGTTGDHGHESDHEVLFYLEVYPR